MTDVRAYYNEIDPYCAQWLRNLIAAGHIAPGDVDERSIEDVRPSDLRGYTQCHFFAGIGLWSYALRLAGWPDDRPCWTGSCPCQPFSAAGKGDGFADERHLWPAWFHLIREHRPSVIFGEQVEAAIAHGWLDLVQDDLEGAGYSFGALTLNSASVGAPNARHRVFWLADADADGCESRSEGCEAARHGQTAESNCGARELGVAAGSRIFPGTHRRVRGGEESAGPRDAEPKRSGLVGNASCARLQECVGAGGVSAEQARSEQGEASLRASFWSDADWIHCRDGKSRPVEPGTFPLAHGSPSRVGRLRAYGNAINPQVAAEFIKAYREPLT